MSVNVSGNILSSTGFTTSGEIANYPNIVTDGLILWLDAGNNASYINSSSYYDCGYGCQYYASSPGCTNCNTQIKDMSGFGYDMPLNNGASVIYDNTGGYIYFDGIDNNLKLSTTSFNRSNGDAMSVGVWMYPGRNAGQYQDIVSNRSDAVLNWLLYQHATDGSIQFHGSAQNKSSYIPTLNTWIHVMATVTTGGISTLYVNGAVQQTVSSYTYGTNTASLLCVGVFGTLNEPYLGRINPIYIYNKALSADEVLQNFNTDRRRFGL